MPVHDWRLVHAGVFHDFDTVWIGQIRTALNSGLLPDGYYALAEQHAGDAIADVLTLHANDQEAHDEGVPPSNGGVPAVWRNVLERVGAGQAR